MTTQRKASYEQNTNEESLDTALLDKVTQELKAQKLGKSRKKTGMSFFGGSSFICAVSSVAAFFAAPYLLPYILAVSAASVTISIGVAINGHLKEKNAKIESTERANERANERVNKNLKKKDDLGPVAEEQLNKEGLKELESEEQLNKALVPVEPVAAEPEPAVPLNKEELKELEKYLAEIQQKNRELAKASASSSSHILINNNSIIVR